MFVSLRPFFSEMDGWEIVGAIFICFLGKDTTFQFCLSCEASKVEGQGTMMVIKIKK